MTTTIKAKDILFKQLKTLGLSLLIVIVEFNIRIRLTNYGFEAKQGEAIVFYISILTLFLYTLLSGTSYLLLLNNNQKPLINYIYWLIGLSVGLIPILYLTIKDMFHNHFSTSILVASFSFLIIWLIFYPRAKKEKLHTTQG